MTTMRAAVESAQPDALRLAAQAVKAWSNIDDFWMLPDSDCGETVLGAIEEGEKYELLTIDADTYGTDGESVKLAQFYAAANPGAVLALLDERDRLHAQVSALTAERALPAVWRSNVRELLGHISDVLSDEEFDKIDTPTWNAVSALVCAAALARQEPTNA